MTHITRIASRLLWREWRSGEFNLLSIALVIAVASMTSVAFITDRVASALQHRAGDLIAADLILNSTLAPKETWGQEASARGVAFADVITFVSVVLAGDKTSLASIKAVSSAYPLRGTLKTGNTAYTAGEPTTDIPAPGKVWLDSRLLNALDVSIGSRVELGTMTLTVSRILTFEPDFGGDLFSTAPRLLMNISDVASTELIGPGSRVSYRQLYAAPRESIHAYASWLRDRLRPEDTLQDIREARPELKTALERADSFLGLTALIAVMLATVAIVIAARRFAQRHRSNSALMRTFGAVPADILKLFIIQLGILGSAAALLGCIIGYGVHLLMVDLFGHLIQAELPPVRLLSAVPGFITGLLLIFSFALPPLYRLRNIPPIQVLHGGELRGIRAPLIHYSAAIVLFPALILWQASDIQLAAVFLAGLLVTVLVLGAAAALLLVVIEKIRLRTGVTLRIGLTYLTRRRHNTLTEAIGFGLGMMAIILLVLVRTDLMEDWLVSLPENTPNQFVINIQAGQISEIVDYFAQNNRPAPSFYPMVRARLTEINGQPVAAENYDDPRTQRLATRVFNLSWSAQLQPGNEVIAGNWWPASGQSPTQFSFDQGLAERLHIGLGDRLTFFSAGEKISAEVTSLRHINWDTFQPNFFVLTPPAALASFPATFISSFYVSAEDKAFINHLLKRFRNLTVIDVEQMIEQVKTIMDSVSMVLQFVFFFTLSAGLLVLFATMQSTHDERMRDNAIMKTLGATRTQLRRILLIEFLFIGLLSSIIATLAANLTGYGVARWLLKIPYQLHFESSLLSVVIGTTAISAVGLLAFRQYHRMTATGVLRRT